MCFRFIPNDADAGELRGAQLFREWKEIGYGHPHETHLMSPGMHSMEITNCEAWFILMPGNRAVADYVVGAQHPIVVDYYGDVLRIAGEHASDKMREAGLTVPVESWEWWATPEPRDSILRSLAAATIVTTPWPELVEPLREINPTVMLLPDYKPFLASLAFRLAWEQVNTHLMEGRRT